MSYLLFCGSGLFEKLSKAREKKDDDLDQDLLDVKEDDEDGTGDRQVVYKNGRPVLVQAPRRSQPQN